MASPPSEHEGQEVHVWLPGTSMQSRRKWAMSNAATVADVVARVAHEVGEATPAPDAASSWHLLWGFSGSEEKPPGSLLRTLPRSANGVLHATAVRLERALLPGEKHLIVRFLLGPRVDLIVCSEWTFEEVKRRISALTGIPVRDLRVIWSGRGICDEYTVDHMDRNGPESWFCGPGPVDAVLRSG
eukprot:TRINITY_DN8434_c0_g1_i1.p1 TRINITY_DN8434_c0_g1~~TRINITY_DN8434_c0_g1_i1.p1  ORF type:complete len:186 (-),score=17.74 TRINITY_DN8434_c0_g1_i1:472-1029(-)